MIGPFGNDHLILSSARLVRYALMGCALGALSACSSAQSVPRRNGDMIEMGRHIPPQAYAWYARGIHFEQTGHLREAEFAYQAAIDLDRQSGSAWASLVRVRCQNNDKKALEAAAQGLSQSLRHAPIFTERARCLLSTWEKKLPQPKATRLVQQALSDAQAAVALEPNDMPANQLTVEIYRALSQDAQADKWTRAYGLFTGSSLFEETTQAPPVDELLAQGRLREARIQAAGLIAPGELAVRALALNRPQVALEQAQMILRASPQDADANLVLLVSEENTNAFQASQVHGQLSPIGMVVFLSHLKRTAGSEAARIFWKQRSPGLLVSGDPLAQLLLDHLALEKGAAPTLD